MFDGRPIIACVQSTINKEPSTSPRAHRAFARRGGNRFRCRIAECEQDAPGFFFLLAGQFTERGAKRHRSIIVPAAGAFNAVEERGDFNQFVPGVEKIEVENLLPCHIYLRFAIGD